MSKTFARATAPLFALTLAWGLSACSSPSDDQVPLASATQPAATDTAPAAEQAPIDTYAAALQAQIPSLLDTYSATYSDIRIASVKPATIEYAYVYLEQNDPTAVAAYFDGMVPTLQTLCDTQLFPEMANFGVTVDPKVRYTYYNPDGSLIWTHDFSPS